jgi:hypothetical protein
MPVLNLFKRNTSKPRTSIRERFRNAAARVMPRTRGTQPGGGTDTSRRALMAGSLASVAVAPIGAMAASREDDAALIELSRRAFALFEARQRFEKEVEEPADARRSELLEAIKEPEQLFAQRHDVTCGLHGLQRPHPFEKGRSWYGEMIEHLRDKPRQKQCWSKTERVMVDGEWGVRCTYVPDPVGQARADEIVMAYDRWLAQRKAAEQESGYTAASAEWCRMTDEIDALERQIAETPARTLKGLIAKAQWADGTGAPLSIAGQLEKELDNDGQLLTIEALALSIARDLLAMNGGQA